MVLADHCVLSAYIEWSLWLTVPGRAQRDGLGTCPSHQPTRTYVYSSASHPEATRGGPLTPSQALCDLSSHRPLEVLKTPDGTCYLPFSDSAQITAWDQGSQTLVEGVVRTITELLILRKGPITCEGRRPDTRSWALEGRPVSRVLSECPKPSTGSQSAPPTPTHRPGRGWFFHKWMWQVLCTGMGYEMHIPTDKFRAMV